MMEDTKTFLSYAREDAAFALQVTNELRSKQIHIWLDQLDNPGGKPSDRTAREALRRCDVILVVLSPASVESNYVMEEVIFALKKSKRVIPLMYSECDVPFPLQQFPHIDFTAGQALGIAALRATLTLAQ